MVWRRIDFLDVAERVSGWRFFLAVRRGLSLVVPIVMVGALALMVLNFPLPAFQDGMDALFGHSWRVSLENLVAGSFGIASLAVLCAFSGTMASLCNQRRKGQFVSPLMAAVVVLSCFFVFLSPARTDSWIFVFSMDRGLLVALGVAVLGSILFLRLAQVSWLHLPLRVVGNDPVVRDILTVMPAGMVTIVIFGACRMLYSAAGITHLHDTVQEWLMSPFAGADIGLGFTLSYVSLSQFFWFFGAHGPNLLFGVEESILVPTALSNSAALAAGAELPFIVTKQFIDSFTRMGGSGCTLCFILAILLRSRDGGVRRFCLFAAFPALCNVNEPLLFGIPLVLNPIYAVPFLLTPVVQTLAAYGATVLDLVPRTSSGVVWTTPALISGYVATGSIAGTIMQGVNLALGVAIYIPFVTLADRLRERQGRRVLDDLLHAAESLHTGVSGRKCLDQPGEVGRAAKALANDLEMALAGGRQLFLEYQPQVDVAENRVKGVEALLRWKHPSHGRIPPPIIVALAEDMGCIDRLGLFILTEACTQRAKWKGRVADDLVISVNVSPRQLQNSQFDRDVIEIVDRAGLSPSQLEVEITESMVVEPDTRTIDVLRRLREAGVRVAIDDFGMGHTSLRYLREFPVDTVKIDRSLTVTSKDNVNDHIVRSIVELSRSLRILTVVEGVEENGQVTRFLGLGCGTFQGYLFSRPVSGDDCAAFIQRFSDRPGGEKTSRLAADTADS